MSKPFGDSVDDLPQNGSAVTLEDFWAYAPTHNYLYIPTLELWPSSSVNSRLPAMMEDGKPVMPATWLDKYGSVEQMTWAPGEPMIIEGRHVASGGWIDRRGARCFNQYRPPIVAGGNPAQAYPWTEHVNKLYADENAADHIISWLAHRVQHPDVKPNHGLLLGGPQGIGKDTLLEPIKHAVGPWNFSEVSPQQMLGRFNGFVKSVVLRISEARDLGDIDRYAFYEHMKIYLASPPDVLRVDEKHLREHAVLNCCRVILTTNHKTGGIYLPDDDRRHFVAWSDCKKEDFSPDYWNQMWSYYYEGGFAHVAAYLLQLDISAFDPKAPPATSFS